jgi:hypothetical protein
MYVYSYVLSFDIAYRTAESRDGDGVSCFLWIPGYVRCRVASNHVRVARFSKVFTITTGQPSPNSSDYIPILAPFTHIPSPVLIPARSFPPSGLLLNLVHLTPVPMITHGRLSTLFGESGNEPDPPTAPRVALALDATDAFSLRFRSSRIASGDGVGETARDMGVKRSESNQIGVSVIALCVWRCRAHNLYQHISVFLYTPTH